MPVPDVDEGCVGPGAEHLVDPVDDDVEVGACDSQ